ncbi:unnamed protein product [Leptidea sinapis]|uniref:Uncharacterized protein n=1 Tax=Leptidea sinapis TaxID=189913 RepID=A0A5E4PY76_9NEOP|nr:unnamed protein product [Leptidea sinapis]
MVLEIALCPLRCGAWIQRKHKDTHVKECPKMDKRNVLALTEESSYRDVQSTELETLRSKLVLVDERSQHFLSTLVSLRAALTTVMRLENAISSLVHEQNERELGGN